MIRVIGPAQGRKQYLPSPEYRKMFERATGDEAKPVRHQYLSIEEALERAYRAVCPCDQNADAFSFKFADVLRSACGTYELLTKTLYGRFYAHDPAREGLDVFNYLALERFLDPSDRRALHLLALDQYPLRPELTQPFRGMAGWDKRSPVSPGRAPGWWTAYNNMKHDMAGLRTAATLGHATAAVAAVFVLAEQVYGFGLLSGGHYEVPTADPSLSVVRMISETRWARLSGRPS